MSGECEEEVACFVCADSAPPLYRVCHCNTFVHERCFEDVVSSVPSHACGCPVCLRAYRAAERTDRSAAQSKVASLLTVAALAWYAAVLTKMLFFLFITACSLFVSLSVSTRRRTSKHVLGASHQMHHTRA